MSEPFTQREYGVASPALPAPEPQGSRRGAERLAALVPRGRLVVRHGRTTPGVHGAGFRWGIWREVPQVGPEPADTSAPLGRRHAAQGGHNAVDLAGQRRELGYTYPIDRPPGDMRLSGRLLNDLTAVLEAHGFPRLQSGRDFVRLASMLDRYLYRRSI